ncbi:MAG: tRNA (adenosine(37)-N6)-threonylcarbamoyltransferase complex ATPase subunit type 1 TsaE [bacterium]|nr:tRNA (adenosine(37)-N6)-threonylcarbamoyltransferase complex ATPase subunit type 1 TsaE [bacterium]
MVKSIFSHSEEETKTFGKEIGKGLSKGDIVALFGELGAGKTVLVKGICEGLGITEGVKSPSFTIVREYISQKPRQSANKVYHIDLYRITDPSTILVQEIYEYLRERNGICIIEWADRIEDILPSDTTKIYLKIFNETEREIFCS